VNGDALIRLTILLLGVMVATRAAFAQESCAGVMVAASRQAFRIRATDRSLSKASDITFTSIARAVSRAEADGRSDRTLGHVDVQWIPTSLRDSILGDSAVRQDFTKALAEIIQSSPDGFPDAQAVAASDLYRAWQLSPAPAWTILSDPMVTVRDRLLALYAVRTTFNEVGFQQAAVSALCSVEARDRGMRDVVGDSGFTRLAPSVLTRDESSLVTEIINMLRRAREVDSASVDRLIRVLPSRSSITRDVVEGIRVN